MSADCNWSLTMTGKSRNKYLTEILDTLYKIEQVDQEQGSKIFDVYDGKNYFTKKTQTSISTDNGTARFIWGDNYLEPIEDIYIQIAKAAPNASWTVWSDRTSLNGGEGSASYMEAVYEKGVLEFKTECYVDVYAIPQLIDRMKRSTGSDDTSFEAFCRYYHTDGSISEEEYDEYRNFDEMTDTDMGNDYYLNCRTNTVSSHHVWEIKTISIM